jgi:hypothetical protein
MSINDGNIVLGPGEGKIIPVPGWLNLVKALFLSISSTKRRST